MRVAFRPAAVALTLLVLLPGSSGAEDQGPPRAILRHGDLRQAGRLIALRWTEPAGSDGCTSTLVLSRVRYPTRGLPVGEGRFRARVRFTHPQRPRSVEVTARPRLDQQGDATGRPAEVRLQLRPRRPSGGDLRAWAAILTSRVEDELYLRVTARWRDRDACGDRQRATWTFHVAAR
jgi:hypothetical protein